MYCQKCRNKLDANDKFCTVCGIKNTLVVNSSSAVGNYYKLLSNKALLVMFLINYILCILPIAEYDSVLNFIFSFVGGCIIMISVDPFHLISIILCIRNIKNYKRSYVVWV